MGRTFIRQDAQISSTLDTLGGFVDNTSPGAAMETGPGHILDDLNNIRSILNLHLKADQSLNWHDDLTAPSTLEAGTKRGIDEVNDGLHAVEKKRVLRNVHNLTDVAVPATQNWVVLGSGELPAQTTAAVGAVTTLGTVVATHGGSFDSHDLAEVAGGNALTPKNLVLVVDGASRDPILSAGRRIYGLLQGESGLSDGDTILTTTPDRVQISFVRINTAGDDLEACPVADIESTTINYSSRERVRLEDLNEFDFLDGAIVDVPQGATVTRQGAYDNQGATPVDVTTNSILDLEGAGLAWRIRDDLEAMLFEIVEGSAGSTSQVNIGSDVDEFDVDALVNNFDQGVSIASGKTRPIDVGVNDGIIESTAGALEVQAVTTLSFDDGNKPVGWSLAEGVHLSDAAQEWTDFEANFGGEVSLLDAINQAYEGQIRTKVQAVLTSDVSSGNDVNGPGTPHSNTDVDLAPFNNVTFVDDVEVFLNGELLRNATGATEDVYPGGTPADGDLMFTFNLKGTGSKPDQLTVIVNGQ